MVDGLPLKKGNSANQCCQGDAVWLQYDWVYIILAYDDIQSWRFVWTAGNLALLPVLIMTSL